MGTLNILGTSNLSFFIKTSNIYRSVKIDVATLKNEF